MTVSCIGVVKWYDAKRSYGIVHRLRDAQSDEKLGEEVFVGKCTKVDLEENANDGALRSEDIVLIRIKENVSQSTVKNPKNREAASVVLLGRTNITQVLPEISNISRYPKFQASDTKAEIPARKDEMKRESRASEDCGDRIMDAQPTTSLMERTDHVLRQLLKITIEELWGLCELSFRDLLPHPHVPRKTADFFATIFEKIAQSSIICQAFTKNKRSRLTSWAQDLRLMHNEFEAETTRHDDHDDQTNRVKIPEPEPLHMAIEGDFEGDHQHRAAQDKNMEVSTRNHETGKFCKTEAPSSMMKTDRNKDDKDVIVILEDVRNPSNVGMLFRTFDAMGVKECWILNHRVTKMRIDGSISNAARGVEKYLTIRRFNNFEECIKEAKREGREIWATYIDATQNAAKRRHIGNVIVVPDNHTPDVHTPDAHTSHPIGNQKIALVLGSESEGISEKMLTSADWTVYYPMDGKVESLNVAVCGALVLHEIKNYSTEGILKFQRRIK